MIQDCVSNEVKATRDHRLSEKTDKALGLRKEAKHLNLKFRWSKLRVKLIVYRLSAEPVDDIITTLSIFTHSQ